MTGFELKPLDHVGVEVVGLDLTKTIPSQVAEDLYAAWMEHGIMLFRKAGTSPEVHMRLSKVFGELEEHPIKSLLVDNEKNLISLGGVGAKKGTPVLFDGELRAGFIFFHQDTTFTPNVCKGSVLRMLQVPERGGDTIWTDTAKAYDGLSQSMKERLEGLSSIQCFRAGSPPRLWGWPGHTVEKVGEDVAPASSLVLPDFPLVVHPFIITHPETGRKSLLISPLNYIRIDGMDQAESDALYEELATHVLRPDFAYHHKWSPNDMVLWDNRRSLHCALGYPYEQTRFAHRTTLLGAMQTGRYYDEARALS
jgi:taurine dioxygenase